MAHRWIDIADLTVLFACPCGHRKLCTSQDEAIRAARTHLHQHPVGDKERGALHKYLQRHHKPL